MIPFFHELRTSRTLRTALLVSALWHLVWLFVIFIDIEAPGAKPRLEPKIYFVGPILTDDAFNMILASKPELSSTVYRSAAETAPGLEPQAQEMERPDPGDLVSVPLGQSTWSSLRGRVLGEKPYPEAMFRKKLPVSLIPWPFPVEGTELKERGLLSAPVFPALPDRSDVPWVDPEYEITVLGTGRVSGVRMLISSGDPQTDLLIGRYLEQWQFIPLDETRQGHEQRGKVRIPDPAAGVS